MQNTKEHEFSLNKLNEIVESSNSGTLYSDITGGKPIYVKHNDVKNKNFIADFMKKWAW